MFRHFVLARVTTAMRWYPGRKLIIGGVTIPHATGLLGHSDADVLLHAITDAIFGAAGLGDIGRHFPDTDAQFSGADSRVLLREAVKRVAGGRLCDRQYRRDHHRAGAENGAAYCADDCQHCGRSGGRGGAGEYQGEDQ